jgi:hypothetical protein
MYKKGSGVSGKKMEFSKFCMDNMKVADLSAFFVNFWAILSV